MQQSTSPISWMHCIFLLHCDVSVFSKMHMKDSGRLVNKCSLQSTFCYLNSDACSVFGIIGMYFKSLYLRLSCHKIHNVQDYEKHDIIYIWIRSPRSNYLSSTSAQTIKNSLSFYYKQDFQLIILFMIKWEIWSWWWHLCSYLASHTELLWQHVRCNIQHDTHRGLRAKLQ